MERSQGMHQPGGAEIQGAPPAERALTCEDKQSFDQRGYIRLKGVLSHSQIESLRRAVDDQFVNRHQSNTAYDLQQMAEQFWLKKSKFSSEHADRFDLELLNSVVAEDREARPLFDRPPSSADRDRSFFYEAAGWRKFREIREVAMDSNLPEICADLMRSDYVNFWEDTTFVKSPGASLRTPFHQDMTYFQIRGRKCCIVWIPLDETTTMNGALEYVEGSHLWEREFAPNAFVSQTPLPNSPYDRLPDIEANRDDYDIKMVCAEPGDIIIHNVMTIHGAAGNCSQDKMRRAISFRYCGDDVRYWNKPGAIRQPWIKDHLSDGDALYSEDYPRVWPRPYPKAKLSRLYEHLDGGCQSGVAG